MKWEKTQSRLYFFFRKHRHCFSVYILKRGEKGSLLHFHFSCPFVKAFIHVIYIKQACTDTICHSNEFNATFIILCWRFLAVFKLSESFWRGSNWHFIWFASHCYHGLDNCNRAQGKNWRAHQANLWHGWGWLLGNSSSSMTFKTVSSYTEHCFQQITSLI